MPECAANRGEVFAGLERVCQPIPYARGPCTGGDTGQAHLCRVDGAGDAAPAYVARERGFVPRPLGASIGLSAFRTLWSDEEERERRMDVVEAFRYHDAGNGATRTGYAAVGRPPDVDQDVFGVRGG